MSTEQNNGMKPAVPPKRSLLSDRRVRLLLSLLGAVIGIAKAFVDTAPTLDLAALDAQDKTSFIYDSEGNLITDYKGTEDRIMVSIDEIPEMLQNAFIAVEDARFYEHNGVDVKRIVGALVANFTSGSTQGGSTITQQLIKQTVLSSEQSYKRKLQEAYLAMELETRYTKKQILESYLNTIFLGGSYYGVRVAAYGYFGKELDELTVTRKFRGSEYEVHILNHAGDEKGAIHLIVDGKSVDGCVIPADGKPGKHHVEAVIE